MNDENNARNWLFNLHDVLSQEEYTVLVVTLWAIWRARRKAIYEDVFQSPQATNQFIKAYLRDLQVIQEPGPVRRQQTAARPTRWLPPMDGCTKINVDAAVARGRGVAAAICYCVPR